jgi:hypothetical protein
MHEMLVAGTRLELSDAVADALWEYQVALLAVGGTGSVEIPVIFDGSETLCRLILNPAAPIALVARPLSGPGSLKGEDRAIENLQLQAATIVGGAEGREGSRLKFGA